MLTGFLYKLFAISCFRIHKLISFLFFFSHPGKKGLGLVWTGEVGSRARVKVAAIVRLPVCDATCELTTVCWAVKRGNSTGRRSRDNPELSANSFTPLATRQGSTTYRGLC